MDIRALRYFVAVAGTGHMTRAAEQLGIQQPPLSLQIKALERELGVLLFRRHPRGVALTDAGRLFQAEALRMLQDMEAMKQRMARVAKGQAGTLAVGFTSSAAAHRFMPEALRAFRRAYPAVELQLREDNAAELTDALAAGRLHCGLLRVPVARPEGLVFETLLREPVLVAMPSDHRFALARTKLRARCRWPSCARKASSSCGGRVRPASMPSCSRCAMPRGCARAWWPKSIA